MDIDARGLFMTNIIKRISFFLFSMTFFSITSFVIAANKTIHVLPMLWDSRQNQTGWKVLLRTDGSDIHVDKADVVGITPENNAWDALRSVGLARPGRWSLCFHDRDRSGHLNTFCFYEVQHNDYAILPHGFHWVRISQAFTSVIASQYINSYIKWSLEQFLARNGFKGRTQQSGQVHRGVAVAANLALMVPAWGQYVAYNPMPPMQGWYALAGAILFDRDNEPSFAFTNFYQSPVQIPNFYTGLLENWPAVENYFQAMKTNDQRIQASLRGMTPMQALSNKPASQAHWYNTRFDVMRIALEAKFMPGTTLGNMLFSTRGRVLVEKTFNRAARELEWGADDGIQGKNHLGRLLMVIRDSMLDQRRYPYDPQNTYSLQRIENAVRNGLPLEYAR